jgi:hypothetical protein
MAAAMSQLVTSDERIPRYFSARQVSKVGDLGILIIQVLPVGLDVYLDYQVHFDF